MPDSHGSQVHESRFNGALDSTTMADNLHTAVAVF